MAELLLQEVEQARRRNSASGRRATKKRQGDAPRNGNQQAAEVMRLGSSHPYLTAYNLASIIFDGVLDI